ncbi:MAG: FG-GAP repeat domain-containing protein, partial [Chthoniobacterales bacterium]
GLYLSLGNGDGTFLPAYLVWTEPISVFVTLANGINSFAVGDFNDDGKLDVALNINGARVDVLLGTGTGAFVSTGTIEIDQHQSGGDGLGQIAASKLSKNGHVDLVVDTGYGATLVILRGNGDGTFQSPTIYPLPQTEDEGVIVTDLNNDGAPDIAIGTAGGFSTTNYMTVLLNNGDGDFGPIPPLFPVTTIPSNEPATNAVGVTLSDLTNSGKLDLIVTTWNTPIEPAINGQLPPVPSINPQTTSVNTRGAIAVLAGNGDGTFQTEQQFYVDGRRPTGVAAADLDGDGKNDVVTANAVDNNISILKGNGDHTFQTSIPIAVGTNPTAVAVADVNGDKKPDIIVTNLADNTVAVLLNQSTPGNLAFAAPVNYAVATYPDSVVAGDFNHDGKVDLVVLGAGNFFASDDSGKHTRLSVLLGNGDGTFAPAVTQTLDNQDGGESLVAADFGRGEIDLAVAHFNKNEVLILQDDGHGNFTKTASYQTGAGPEGLVAVDLDGDGKSDIAVGNLNDHTVTVLTGNGDGTFVSTGNRAGVLEPFGNATWHYPAFVAAGDLDGDAKPDLVTTHLFEAAAAVLRNTSPDVPKSTPTPTPSATANPSATVTPTATATPTVTPSPATTATPTPSPTTTPSPAQLLNISGRVVAQTGDNVAIAGFIISGSHAKHVLVRGMGPSMRANGQRVSGALEDPTIELHDASDALVASNVDWRSDQQNDIQATGLAPSDDREAAIVRDLPAGRYTAIVKGANSTAGVALAEVFDLQPNQGGELGNLSVRANVGTDDDVLIDGLIIGGSEPKQVLFRALGPELAARNVFNPLQDPTLELHDANGALLIANDNWGDAPNRDAIKATGMAPRHDSESAILTTLSPGQYTSILRGANRTTGVALAEVYKLN